MLDMSNMLMVLLIHTTKVSFLLKVFMTLPHSNKTVVKQGVPSMLERVI